MSGSEPAMPGWLEQVAAVLDMAPPRSTAALRVLHDWHARCVLPLVAEVLPADAPIEELRATHERAASGARVERSEWTDVLRPAVREVYLAGYDYHDAYAVAHANAVVYADANGFTPPERDEFATYYAKLNTGANLTSFADANAIVHARVVAAAFADGDTEAYARTHPAAWIRACVQALAAPARPENGTVAMPIDESLITVRDHGRRAARAQLAAGLGKSMEMAF